VIRAFLRDYPPQIIHSGADALSSVRLPTDRNSHIPTGLPAVWATLSQLHRVEALARSITDRD
jgi:hypothetical protein